MVGNSSGFSSGHKLSEFCFHDYVPLRKILQSKRMEQEEIRRKGLASKAKEFNSICVLKIRRIEHNDSSLVILHYPKFRKEKH